MGVWIVLPGLVRGVYDPYFKRGFCRLLKAHYQQCRREGVALVREIYKGFTKRAPILLDLCAETRSFTPVRVDSRSILK